MSVFAFMYVYAYIITLMIKLMFYRQISHLQIIKEACAAAATLSR